MRIFLRSAQLQRKRNASLVRVATYCFRSAMVCIGVLRGTFQDRLITALLAFAGVRYMDFVVTTLSLDHLGTNRYCLGATTHQENMIRQKRNDHRIRCKPHRLPAVA